MPKKVLVYRGWIGGKREDRETLTKLGVSIAGDWNPIGTFDYCAMTLEVHEEFVHKWKGRGVWGLIAKLEEVYTRQERAKQEEDEDIPF